MGDDFTLNVLNISALELAGVNLNGAGSGLLELHIGHDKKTSMNIGSGGANVSPDTVYAAGKGAAVWGFDIATDIYMADHDFIAKGSFQESYNFGDAKQRDQLYVE